MPDENIDDNNQQQPPVTFTQEQLDAKLKEAVNGLKTKNSELLTNINNLKKNQLPEGMTAEDIEAFNTYKAEQATAEENLLKEKGEFETIKANINAEWQEKLDVSESEKTQLQKDLNDYVARDLINQALAEAKASESSALLMPHILPQISVVKNEDGSYAATTGKTNDVGEEVTLSHVIAGLKANPAFSMAFGGINEGGGAPGSGGGQDLANNPWKTKNKTEQAKLMNKDINLAREMAKAAGVDPFF